MYARRARKPCRAALLAALIAAAVAPSVHADDRSVRRELEAFYTQFGRLLKQEHRYPLKRFFLEHTTEDFVSKDDDGKKTSREDAAEMLEEGPLAIARFTHYDFRILKLTVKGNQAVVLYRDRAVALLPDAQERLHKLTLQTTSRDTWVKTPEGWKTRLSEVLTSKMLLDGKEVKPKRARR